MTEDQALRAAQTQLMELIAAYSASQALYCAVELGVPDIIKEGPRSVEAIAAACGCPTVTVERLLRALSTVGLFARSAAGYGPTLLSRQLQRDAPHSLAPTALFHGNEVYRAFSHLLHTVRTGTAGWEEEFGQNLWEYLDSHPDRGALFDTSMRTNHSDDLESIAAVIVGRDSQTLVDIGGGDGSFLRRILERHSTWRGILFDRPEVVARTRTDAAWDRLRVRCEFRGGDFFAEVPQRADQYVLRHVLHDWNDADCTRILNLCRSSMGTSGKLVVIEQLMGHPASRGLIEWSDLSMMVLGGFERSVAAFHTLLEQSGFAVTAVKPAGPRVFAIEAKPALAAA
jgi:hypothetical protein